MKGDHTICYYCQLHDPRVEAGGLWHCPNPACPGPGAQYWRSQNLESYRDLGGNDGYTVDAGEMIAKARTILDSGCCEPAIATAIRRVMPRWEEWQRTDNPDRAP